MPIYNTSAIHGNIGSTKRPTQKGNSNIRVSKEVECSNNKIVLEF